MLKNLKLLSKVIKIHTLSAPPIGACMFHFSKPLKKPDNFINDLNSAYLERMYNSWVKDKKSVDASWDAFFSNVIDGPSQESSAFSPTLSQGSPITSEIQVPNIDIQSSVNMQRAIADSMKVVRLIKAYQRRGHELADLDPLRIPKDQDQSGFRKSRNPEAELDYKYYGFSEADLDREFYLDTESYSGFLRQKQIWKLGDVIDNLKMIYCRKAGFEYFHISDLNERNWLREKIEELPFKTIDKERKLAILRRLSKNNCLANFLRQRFPTTTRFSLDGCDTVISGLKAMVYKASELDVKRMVFGMAHRGRLNTLTEIIGKTYEELMCEFQDHNHHREDHEISWGNSGDVKYHLGTTSDSLLANGKTMRLSMLPNPAHLEAVDPLVQGKTRAIQDYYRETNRDKTIAVSIHGDAGFAAQGVVYETFQMYDLEDFRVGGTIHIVINNQIGFTTTEKEGRSGLYCTEIGKIGEAPIFHVNADEPELVDQIFELALDYRLKFQKNVIVDLIGYRRYGHNEVDQPAFTQPLMYKSISNMKPIIEKYSEKLIQEGVISPKEYQEQTDQYNKRLESAFEKSKTQKFEQGKWIIKPAEDILESTKHGTPRDTGVNVDLLKSIGQRITTIPLEVTPHPQLKKIYDTRRNLIEQGKGIDWATAESLAFATLVLDGYGVRLSGEDVERGTFSQRHAVIFDQIEDAKYVPIQQLLPEEERYRVTFANSSLCEFGVSGFEYGYSLAHPNILCLWEAQFGDFSNEAQVIIDSFIAAGESRWGGQSGLVMLLPHGYDGQGPDHSSARLERFLELSDDDPFSIPTQAEYESDKELAFRLFNIQVCVPTTPANYFHLLRRQLRRSFRKPLIIMTPKKLLRHRLAKSDLDEFKQGFRFRRIYSEMHPKEINEPKKIRKVICCSGQVYFDLLEMRRAKQIQDTAILRFEQLAPFPYDQVRLVCLTYPNAKIVWCQEEPFNMGAWSFVQPRFNKILDEFNKKNIVYNGRKPAPATAVGSPKLHMEEVERFINEVFEI